MWLKKYLMEQVKVRQLVKYHLSYLRFQAPQYEILQKDWKRQDLLKKITDTGKKALEARKDLNKKERMSYQEMSKLYGDEICKRGTKHLWGSAKDKNGNVTLKRDPISERK